MARLPQVAAANSDRRILHCDMDSFYAAVHVRDAPSLRGRPIVVGGSPEGRGVVAAASYEARKFGVRSAMPAARARRLCPNIVFIRPDFPRYRRESAAVFEIFRRYTETIQPVSIDEAYLDVSCELSRFGSATAIAEEIRDRVRAERRLTVSIGVGPNRLVAKIASDFDKPDGLTVVPPHRVARFLAPLSVRALPGVGPVMQARLEGRGLRTIGELRSLSIAELTALVGSSGAALHGYCRGLDERPVRTRRHRKSLSCERTYERDLESLGEMDRQLELISSRVAKGLARRNLSASTITVKVRYENFETVTRSRTLTTPVADERGVARWAKKLLRSSAAGERRVRLLGVGASNLCVGGVDQLELFSTIE